MASQRRHRHRRCCHRWLPSHPPSRPWRGLRPSQLKKNQFWLTCNVYDLQRLQQQPELPCGLQTDDASVAAELEQCERQLSAPAATL